MGRNICLFGLFYYFVNALVQLGRARGIIKETESLFVPAHRNSPCQKNYLQKNQRKELTLYAKITAV